MKHWTLEDIPWNAFDKNKVDSEILAVVKAASLVERNSADYAHYLCNVFPDDQSFCALARTWAEEEIQHGEALGRWAEMADPQFDFRNSFARFAAGYRIPIDVQQSVRGSRAGELIARCVVETGTSSMYSALRDATDEPVLRSICHRIAGDEYRHYKLFYATLQRYLGEEKPWLVRRVRIAMQRFQEAEDDELCYAYHCANLEGQAYDRKRAGVAYATRAFSCYRPMHIERAVSMVLKAVGLRPKGWMGDIVSKLAWLYIQRQLRMMQTA
jgi:rubrerythrin